MQTRCCGCSFALPGTVHTSWTPLVIIAERESGIARRLQAAGNFLALLTYTYLNELALEIVRENQSIYQPY